MALLDVDELLEDPDFLDDFRVTRSVETVGVNGRATFVPQISIYSGIVQPASGRSLLLLPDGARVQGAIEIWTRTQLRMNDGYYAADLITWEHRSYIVSNVEDFSNYGEGYVRAVCTLHDLTGPSHRQMDAE